MRSLALLLCLAVWNGSGGGLEESAGDRTEDRVEDRVEDRLEERAEDRACRCAQRTLAEYYQAADEVFVGSLVETEEHGEGLQRLYFDRIGESYKEGAETAVLPYVSSTSSASCAVEVEEGAVYVVFAEHDRESGVAWLNTCNGTRVHRSADGATRGFDDVPPEFVVSQLEALAGMDALRRVAAATPDPTDPTNEALVGLLDVAAFSHAPEVPVFEGPKADAPVGGVVSSYEDLEHRESGYEVDAAVVFAEVDGWYKVRRADGDFGWLAPDAAGTYWPLEDLLPGRLAYLTLAWNRWVWPQPGAGNPSRVGYPVAERPREQMVNLLGATDLGGTLWLEVEVLASNPCEGDAESIRIRGWVPAYGEAGTPVTWYYSRGC